MFFHVTRATLFSINPILCRGRGGPSVSEGGAGPGILSARGVQPTVAQPRFNSLSVKFSQINNLFPGLVRGLYLRQPAQEAQVQMKRRRRRRRRRGLSAVEGGLGDQTQGSLIECRCPRRVLVCRYLILRLQICYFGHKDLSSSMKLQTFESAL